MLNAASWIEAAEGHGERLKEPDCVVAALYVTVGNRLERTPMARSVLIASADCRLPDVRRTAVISSPPWTAYPVAEEGFSAASWTRYL